MTILIARHSWLFLGYFGVSKRVTLCDSQLPPNPSLPGLFRAIQLKNSAALAAILNGGEAAR
ncbi:hypothetical protein [Candidatus Spongiihabitans sp.]|uniref:hypothetical protein n=1 Tax=Candidatus Spongiihabitans sp. TaxID=3101308 RepID=UPI003C7A0A0D